MCNLFPDQLWNGLVNYMVMSFESTIILVFLKMIIVLVTKKFGGNAQSITRNRWIHHSTFLWDFCNIKLEKYLRHPNKAPDYRKKRNHSDFLCRIKDHSRTNTQFNLEANVISCLQKWFIPQYKTVEQTQSIMNQPHFQRTHVVSDYGTQ